MAATIIPFQPIPFRPSARASAPSPSLAHAQRIVAQIEREIAARAYRQTQINYRLTPQEPAQVVEMEAPANIASRIFHAIKALACSA